MLNEATWTGISSPTPIESQSNDAIVGIGERARTTLRDAGCEPYWLWALRTEEKCALELRLRGVEPPWERRERETLARLTST